jgi:cyclopropane-fatty-acyl-phospholipid synthase
MNYYIIFLLIAILIVTIYLIINYIFHSIELKKHGIIYLLKTFTKGNFIIIDSKGKELIFVNNNIDKLMPIVKIHNENDFFNSIYQSGELGLGESYMKGHWSCDYLIDFLNTICLNEKNTNIPTISLQNIFSNSIDYDKSNIQHHYDVGNDFYLQFLLDDLNAYSCGFWFNENDTLNTAQYNKVNTIIKKMQIKPGQNILDIGCGWGKIAQYVNKITKCKVTGITISDEQAKFARDNYNMNDVVVINMDYRLLSEKFDRIYSIGMFEHVRYENYDSFFQTIKKSLNPNGRLVLHTIITFDDSNKISKVGDNFILKHIFPGGQIPQNDWILQKVRNNGLNTIHFEGFGGQHYAKTLKIWRENMWKSKDYILSKYPMELLLKYDYYFAICEAGFNTGKLGIGHYIIVNDSVLSTDNSFNY